MNTESQNQKGAISLPEKAELAAMFSAKLEENGWSIEQAKAHFQTQGYPFSSTTLKTLGNGSWQEATISDAMWKKISDALGGRRAWVFVDTNQYHMAYQLLEDTHEDGLLTMLLGDQGHGKSLTGDLYKEEHKNVFITEVNHLSDSAKPTLVDLCQQMGKPSQKPASILIGRVADYCKENPNGLLIARQVDKYDRPNKILWFHALYDAIKDYGWGICLEGVPALYHKLEELADNPKSTGYAEFLDRIADWVLLDKIGLKDKMAVIQSNIQVNSQTAKAIANRCETYRQIFNTVQRLEKAAKRRGCTIDLNLVNRISIGTDKLRKQLKKR